MTLGVKKFVVVCAATGSLLTMSALLADPGDAPSASAGTLKIYPPSVQLDAPNDLEHVVIVHVRADGLSREVTTEAQFTTESPNIAAIAKNGAVTALANGVTTLKVTLGELTATIPILVRNLGMPRPVSFRHDVEPVLMKAGCSSGACHGNSRGQEGFRLSLFGYDPAMDYTNLTREIGARRIDPANPLHSLMLAKPLTGVSHGGGKRFDEDSTLHTVLADWIKAGARNDAPDLPALTGIDLFPGECVVATDGGKQQLIVRARFADGSDRDVTRLAVFTSLNDVVAEVTSDGLITPREPGEAFIMARFGSYAAVTQFIVIRDQPFTWPSDVQPRGYIDEAVHAKLRKLRILPSAVCDDYVFLRRVYFDIIALPPTVEEYNRFMTDPTPDKRAHLIDALLARPEFPEVWAAKWAELLRIESEKLNTKGVQLYSAWLRDAIQRDVPLDEIVRQLLTAEGGNFHNPAANFFLVETEPNLVAENVAQVFTGIRIQCAQCHNHPFDRWTQDDYYSFAAFFAQIGRKQAEDPREKIIFNSRSGEVKHLRGGRVMQPKFLGGAAPAIQPGQDRRAVLADWLTAPDNPWFARNIANRIWAHFMGRGMVEPTDDVRISNPPSHPQLLETLGRRFVETGYDIRAIVRDICNSRTYQLATATNDTNAGDQRNFSHAMIRRLSAEQLLDAVSQVTGVPEKFAGLPLGARAMQVADAKSGSYFLTTFGRPPRVSPCTCERRNEATLSQALHLINGDTIWSKLRNGNGRLNKLLEAGTPPQQIIEQSYIATLSRPPTDTERHTALTYIAAAENPREGLEDILWALLNSQEFVFNH